MLQHDIFIKTAPRDYFLIKLNNEWPFFQEKIFVKDGKSHTETNYHLANGSFSTYINYEMPDNGVAAEISGPIRFEVNGNYDCPVFIMNSSDEPMEYMVRSYTCTLSLPPDAVAYIYPAGKVKEDEEAYFEKLAKEVKMADIVRATSNALAPKSKSDSEDEKSIRYIVYKGNKVIVEGKGEDIPIKYGSVPISNCSMKVDPNNPKVLIVRIYT